MGIAEIIGIVSGILKFWDQTVWLIRTLQKTPQERHEELLKRIRAEADLFESTGRPSW